MEKEKQDMRKTPSPSKSDDWRLVLRFLTRCCHLLQGGDTDWQEKWQCLYGYRILVVHIPARAVFAFCRLVNTLCGCLPGCAAL